MQSFAAGPQYLQLPHAAKVWVVEDLLPVSGFLNIFGKPKVGKSFAALQMASCISDATREDFLGFPIHIHGPVCYLQLDTPRELWQQRNQQIALEGWKIDNIFFADREMTPFPFDIHSTGCQYLRTYIPPINPVAVFIDTIRQLHEGDEDRSFVIEKVLQGLELGCRPSAIVIVSHSRKGNPDYFDLMSEQRGSNALPARMDTVLHVGKKQMMYEGRTIGEHKLNVSRTPHYMWRIDNLMMKQKATTLLINNPKESINSLAEIMSEECGLHKEACRSMLRRLKEDKS